MGPTGVVNDAGERATGREVERSRGEPRAAWLSNRMLAAACAVSAMCCPAPAQDATQPTSAPATQGAPLTELPPDVMRELRGIEDFSLRFDHPGYYAVLDFVRERGLPIGSVAEPIEIEDWQTLVERPSEYRGLPITVEGVVGHNKSYQFIDPELQKRFGTMWQLELRHPRRGAPTACTVIFTENADEAGVGSTIRATGYFVMVRRYERSDRSLANAILLVARSPGMIARKAPARAEEQSGGRWLWIVGGVLAAMVVFWIIVRTSARGGRTDVQRLSASHEAPVNLADDLEQWAKREEGGEP